MTKQDAIEKIKKLLALSTSPNEHEAAIAFEKAQAMMKEFLVQDADIKQREEQIISIRRPLLHYKLYRAYSGVYYIFSTVSIKFNCQAIVHPNSATVEIFGYETDVELATYLCDSIINQGKQDYKASLARYGLHSGPSFWTGLARAIYVRIGGDSKVEGEGLILYNKVSEHLYNLFGDLKESQKDTEILNQNIYNEGKRAGEKVSLGAGIKGQGQKQLT